MAPSQPVTQSVILRLREGVHLENAASSVDTSGSPALKAFLQLTETVKAQQGFICQYWGHQIEDPNIFFWSIDWETLEDNVAFVNSKEHNSFNAGLSQVFDFELAAPLILYSRLTSDDAAAAFKSSVTEIAFMTLPNDAGEQARAYIEEASKPINRDVVKVGKATGVATGWVFEGMRHREVPDGQTAALHGVFGYASLDDHIKGWAGTPEYATAIKIMEDMAKKVGLGSSNIGGREMFHVKFTTGT